MLWDKPDFEKRKDRKESTASEYNPFKDTMEYVIVQVGKDKKIQILTEASTLKNLLNRGEQVLKQREDPDGVPF